MKRSRTQPTGGASSSVSASSSSRPSRRPSSKQATRAQGGVEDEPLRQQRDFGEPLIPASATAEEAAALREQAASKRRRISAQQQRTTEDYEDDDDEAYVLEEGDDEDDEALTDGDGGDVDAKSTAASSVATSTSKRKPKRGKSGRQQKPPSKSRAYALAPPRRRGKKALYDPAQGGREDDSAGSQADISKQLNLSAPLGAHQLEVSDDNILALGGSEFVHIVPFSLVLQSDYSDAKTHQEAIRLSDVGDILPLTPSQMSLVEYAHSTWVKDESNAKAIVTPRRYPISLQWSPKNFFASCMRTSYGVNNCTNAIAVLLSDHSLSVFASPATSPSTYWTPIYNVTEKLSKACDIAEDNMVDSDSTLQTTEQLGHIGSHVFGVDPSVVDQGIIFETQMLLPCDAAVTCTSWSNSYGSFPSFLSAATNVSLFSVGTRHGVWIFGALHAKQPHRAQTEGSPLILLKHFAPFSLKYDIETATGETNSNGSRLGRMERVLAYSEYPHSMYWQTIPNTEGSTSEDIVNLELVVGGSQGLIRMFFFTLSSVDGRLALTLESDHGITLFDKQKTPVSRILDFPSNPSLPAGARCFAVCSTTSLHVILKGHFNGLLTMSDEAFTRQRQRGWLLAARTHHCPDDTVVRSIEIRNAHPYEIQAVTTVHKHVSGYHYLVSLDKRGLVCLWNTSLLLELLGLEAAPADPAPTSNNHISSAELRRTLFTIDGAPAGAAVSPSQSLLMIFSATKRHSARANRRWDTVGAINPFLFPWILDNRDTLIRRLQSPVLELLNSGSLNPLQKCSDTFYLVAQQLTYALQDVAQVERQLNFNYRNDESTSNEQAERTWSSEQQCQPYLYEQLVQNVMSDVSEIVSVDSQSSLAEIADKAAKLWAKFFMCSTMLETVIVPMWARRYLQMFEHVRASTIPTYDLRLLDQAEYHIRAEALRLRQLTFLARVMWCVRVLTSSKQEGNLLHLDEQSLLRTVKLLSSMSKLMRILPSLCIPDDGSQHSSSTAVTYVWKQFTALLDKLHGFQAAVSTVCSMFEESLSTSVDTEQSEWAGNCSISINFSTLEALVETEALDSTEKRTLAERIVSYFGDSNLKEFLSKGTSERLTASRHFWCCPEGELKGMLSSSTVLERCALSSNLLGVGSPTSQDNCFTSSLLPTGRRAKCLSKLFYTLSS
eukprot:gb/GECG01012959.1/.p1 GENE.gb/GECG01012959.1/~~gb/GECG01012959.1/.p1  ORF type:complete len:1172 (+),score=131.00 gb/GECG01012959.1/:1-3516(+)